jgi:hypothetical protein
MELYEENKWLLIMQLCQQGKCNLHTSLSTKSNNELTCQGKYNLQFILWCPYNENMILLNTYWELYS